MPNTESGVTTSSTQAYSPPAAAAIMPDAISARIFQVRASMPGGLRGQLVLPDRQQRQAEPRVLHQHAHQRASDQQHDAPATV